MLDAKQINEVIHIAKENNGMCSSCHQSIRFYRHRPNALHAKMLRRMARVVKETGENKINFDDIEGGFSDKSQRTKMRQHGLIAKFRAEDKSQIRNTWLITRKGWDFLLGKPIPERVIVYNNQVIGHDGETITINDLLDAPDEFEQQAITEAESRVYQHAREGFKHMKVRAKYKGYSSGELLQGEIYDLEIDKLQVGKPVKVTSPIEAEYRDIAAFQRMWESVQ